MINQIIENIIELYTIDPRPWVIGYSGGKDSTMLVSLIFEAVKQITDKERKKEIAVVCTDTRVEIPVVVNRVENELAIMNEYSKNQQFNITLFIALGRGLPERFNMTDSQGIEFQEDTVVGDELGPMVRAAINYRCGESIENHDYMMESEYVY